MGKPNGVATPQQRKLAHGRNFNETVDPFDKLDENVRKTTMQTK